jgi:hypothetical protein
MRNSTKTLISYETWYDFKKDLQRRSGLLILNKTWSQIKPRDPLPWNEIHMKTALSGLSPRMQRLTICPRCGGNLVLDRDVDGYFKRCIQCSFSVSFTIPDIITANTKKNVHRTSSYQAC